MTDKIELFTFDTFPINQANSRHYNIAKALAFDPDTFRLVMFPLPSNEAIHLKHALLQFWEDHYVNSSNFSAYEFIEDLLEAIFNSARSLILQKYIDPSVLCLDDVQILYGKSSSEEELYRILKQRLEEKKTTVLFCEAGYEGLPSLHRDELLHLLTLGVHDELDYPNK